MLDWDIEKISIGKLANMLNQIKAQHFYTDFNLHQKC